VPKKKQNYHQSLRILCAKHKKPGLLSPGFFSAFVAYMHDGVVFSRRRRERATGIIGYLGVARAACLRAVMIQVLLKSN
jgi:hypothetical protein